MAENIAAIGVAFDGTDLERGKASLEAIAAAGPKVEASLKAVEASAGKTGKTIGNLGGNSKIADLGKDGAAAAAGMDKLGQASAKAGAAISGNNSAIKGAASSYEAMKAAVDNFTAAEARHMAKLAEEYKQLTLNRGEMERYRAAQAGMSAGAQDLFAAAGKRIDALKMEQAELSKSSAAMNTLKTAAAGLFASLSVGALVGKLVSVQREFDVINSSLITVTGSSAAAAKEMEWIKQFAKETPFGLAQATDGFVKMKALGLDPSRAALASFGNTASAMGKDLNQMIEAVADASTGEFERLKEFGIKAKKDGESVSLTFQGLTKTIGNSAGEITKYLEEIGNNQFAGAMEERAKTLDGTIAALGDTWDELFRTVSASNTGGLIFDSVTLANGALEDATEILRALTVATDSTTKSSGALVATQSGAATFFETVAVLAANTLYVLKQTGDTMWGVAAGYKAFFSFDFDAVRAIGAEMKANGEAARKEIDATTARILNARKEAGIYASYDTRNASAATDPRRLDLGGSSTRPTAPGIDTKGVKAANKELADQAKLLAELSGLSGSFAADWDTLNKLYAKGKLSLEGLTDAQAKLLAKQPAISAGIKAEEEAWKLALKAAQAAADARNKEADSIKAWFDAQESAAAQAIKSATDRITSLQGEEEAARLAAAMNISLASAIERIALARLREKQAGFRANSDGYNALQKEIEAREKILQLVEQKGAREAQAASNQAMVQEWENTVKQYDDIFRQGFADMVNGGENAWKSFTKSLTTTFKTTVADQIYKTFAKPFVVKMVASILGIMGGGAAGAAGGGGYVGMASNAYSMYNAGTQAYTLGGQYLSGTMSGANVMGTAYGNATMTGIDGLLATNGAYGTSAPVVGSGGSGAGAASGAGYAAAAVAAVMLVANAAGMFRSERTVGTGMHGTLGGGDLTSYDLNRLGGTLFKGPDYSVVDPIKEIAEVEARIKRLRDSGGYTWIDQASGQTQTSLDLANAENRLRQLHALYDEQIKSARAQSDAIQASYSAVRTNVGDMADALGLGSEAVRAYTTTLGTDKIHPDLGNLGLKFEGLTQDEIAGKINEALMTASNEMAEMLIGSWETVTDAVHNIYYTPDDGMARYGESITTTETLVYKSSEYAKTGERAIETLTRLATSLGNVNSVFDALGATMLEASLAGGDAASKILEIFGGAEAFNAATGAFYEAYYPEAERMAKSTELLGKEFAKFGKDMPATKDAYRALVTEQLEAGEAGQALAAKLLQLSPAFAQVADYAEQAAAEAAEAMLEWQQKLDIATGKTTQREIDKAAALKTADSATAQLINQLYAFEDAATAAQEAAKAAQEAAKATQEAAKAALNAVRDETRAAIDALVQLYGDLAGAMEQLDPPAKTLVEQWRSNSEELIDITKALAEAMGEIPELTAIDSLKASLATLSSALDGIANISDMIFGLKVGKGDQSSVGILQNRESELWSSLSASADPGAVAAKLASTMLDRIKLQGQLSDNAANDALKGQFDAATAIAQLDKDNRDAQIAAIKEQISGAQTLLDVASSMKGYLAELRFGDLSALNPGDQLNAAQANYASLLSAAQGGDAKAAQELQGGASSYLKEAQGYYGGATSQYAGIFGSVTGELDQFGATPVTDLTLLQEQLTALENITAASLELQTVVTDTTDLQIHGLENIHLALRRREEEARTEAADNKKAVQEQIVALNAIVENQAAQIRQQAAVYEGLMQRLDAATKSLESLDNTSKQTAAAPA